MRNVFCQDSAKPVLSCEADILPLDAAAVIGCHRIIEFTAQELRVMRS